MNGTIGEIRGFGGNFAPRNWSFCNGQLLSIAQNTAAFSILGTTYGGDGRTTFALPDLRGRFALSEGTGPGLSPRPLGQRSGTETVTLNQLQMPSHTHFATGSVNAGTGEFFGTMRATVNISNDSNDNTEGSGLILGQADANLYADPNNSNAELNSEAVKIDTSNLGFNLSGTLVSVTNSPEGGSQYHNNMAPYLSVHYIICLFGVYPSRS